MFLLQSIPVPSADSLAAKKAQIAQTIMNTPPDQLLGMLGQELLRFGLKVLAALAIYAIGAWIIGRIRKLVRRGFVRRNTEPTLASFIDSLVSISLWVILIIITVGALGVNTTSLAALLAAGGMAIGMALSGTVQNFAGGIMLLIFKPFKVGDFIEAQGFSGTVVELTIVSTKLRTTDNRLIILPNGALSNGNINNITVHDIRRVDLDINVSYGADAEKVKGVLLELVKDNPLFLDAETPGAADPFVALKELGDSSIVFVLRAWTKTSDYWPARFQLTEAVYKTLPQKGINFPFPQLDIHIKN
ncbi:MAG: mechanosensitive ion channel [Bacteroidales bacterium]|nr:mechanosensitive ion channel [Bacteroidales bacterium]